MTLLGLKEVMRIQLGHFNRRDIKITYETKHSDVLSDVDGFGSANSKGLYKGSIRWTIRAEGHSDEPWPQNWMELTISGLAEVLYIPKD